jgi:hypothetical protein
VGCPDGTPIIGVPFYLADQRLARIEEELAVEWSPSGRDALPAPRAGHAFNYAYRLYDRARLAPHFRSLLASVSRPVPRESVLARSRAPHSRWYAQKHPTKTSLNRSLLADTLARLAHRIRGLAALAKLEYVDRVMHDLGTTLPVVAPGRGRRCPSNRCSTRSPNTIEAWTNRCRSTMSATSMVISNAVRIAERRSGWRGRAEFIRRHRREIVSRIAYWTGESTITVRAFIDFLIQRSAALELRVRGLDASTLIEITAFGTAVMMNYRLTDALHGNPRGEDA